MERARCGLIVAAGRGRLEARCERRPSGGNAVRRLASIVCFRRGSFGSGGEDGRARKGMGGMAGLKYEVLCKWWFRGRRGGNASNQNPALAAPIMFLSV